jgi:hypothetical protein
MPKALQEMDPSKRYDFKASIDRFLETISQDADREEGPELLNVAALVSLLQNPESGAAARIHFSEALSVLMALWTMLTLNQIRVYTVSGTVAQWYFTPSGSPITGNAARSLKSAVTTSLGTNIFASRFDAYYVLFWRCGCRRS